MQLHGRGLDLAESHCGSNSVEAAQFFLQQSLNRVSTIQNLEAPGALDLLDLTIRCQHSAAPLKRGRHEFNVISEFCPSCFAVRDLRRLGELQTELLGAADFCATFLSCHLLLIKVCVPELESLPSPSYSAAAAVGR